MNNDFELKKEILNAAVQAGYLSASNLMTVQALADSRDAISKTEPTISTTFATVDIYDGSIDR